MLDAVTCCGGGGGGLCLLTRVLLMTSPRAKKGRYGPYYSTVSTDSGLTWSVAIPLKDSDGNYIGCARPHMVQLGNTTLLAGGRMMMGRDYSRAFSIWKSTDNGISWTRADGSYHHNAKASVHRAGLWPVNQFIVP